MSSHILKLIKIFLNIRRTKTLRHKMNIMKNIQKKAYFMAYIIILILILKIFL